MAPSDRSSSQVWSRGGNVLLIGGKPDGAVLGLEHFGANITCVATAKHAAALRGRPLIDATVVVDDPANVEDILLGLARHGLDLAAYDVITSALEYGLVAAAVLASMTDARAVPVSTAVLLRDKHAQKSAVRAAGVPAARSAIFDDPSALTEAVDSVGGLPVVVKPPAGAGSYDTAVLRTRCEVEAWIDSHRSAPWLCEEFISGQELHADGSVRDGTVQSLAISRYFVNLVSVQDGAIIGSAMLHQRDNQSLYDAGSTLVSGALDALGLTTGVFHLEMFGTEDGGLVFSEVGGRVAGGRIDEMIRLTSGVDLHREWAAAALGASHEEVPDSGDDVSVHGHLNLNAREGLITQMPSLEEIGSRPGVVQAELKLRIGSTMPPVKDTNTRAGRAIVRGATFADVHTRALDLATWFTASTAADRID